MGDGEKVATRQREKDSNGETRSILKTRKVEKDSTRATGSIRQTIKIKKVAAREAVDTIKTGKGQKGIAGKIATREGKKSTARETRDVKTIKRKENTEGKTGCFRQTGKREED